jgi:hypothetical protein
MGVGGQRHAPVALYPGKTRYSMCRRLGELHGRSGCVRKMSPLPGFDPRSVHPVAIPAHSLHVERVMNLINKSYNLISINIKVLTY